MTVRLHGSCLWQYEYLLRFGFVSGGSYSPNVTNEFCLNGSSFLFLNFLAIFFLHKESEWTDTPDLEQKVNDVDGIVNDYRRIYDPSVVASGAEAKVLLFDGLSSQ